MQSFRSNISANTIQLAINQFFSLLVFYFLSKGLTKDDFGELNWTLAIFISVFTILSFGIDQMIIKKVAAGENKGHALSLHLYHVITNGLFFYTLLIGLHFIFPGFFEQHSLLLLLGAGKLLLFFSTPFKSIASGQRFFRAVLYMSVSSTIIKGVSICFLFCRNNISLATVIPVFIVADCSELIFGLYLTRKILKVPLVLKFNGRAYWQLLREACPQIGVVVFSAALARMDWILIGFFLPANKLAEYSFAYKAFEMACLPLLVIAPLLVPYFTGLLTEGKSLDRHENVHLLLRVEMAIACLFALCLNIIWNPFVDAITGGKYGAVNTTTVFILSTALPVLYLNNFLWSIHFSSGNTRIIFYSFVLAFSLNLLGNIMLLPFFGNEGAAFSYLLSIAVQTAFYFTQLKEKMIIGRQSLLLCSVCAFCSGLISKYSTLNIWWLLPLSITVYIILLLCTVQLRKTDWQIFKRVVNI
ncbi:MAG: oligosaccharide flippase family protein [Flavisolibacter sp.]|nr:oligosaccharide flippase family protein [Flavisolibacter sp.]MBD0352539.1 oligosaccharide flippase family protein [Flavisolibacter sp.]